MHGRRIRSGAGTLARLAGASLIVGMVPQTRAATTASFQATATIVSGCEISGALPAAGQSLGEIGTLDFGSHSGLSTETVSASLARDAGLTLECTPGLGLMMSLDGGLHASTARNLQAADSSRVAYRLFADPGFGTELVAGQIVPVSVAGPGPITLPIYGRLILPGNGRAGDYTDTVVITLSW